MDTGFEMMVRYGTELGAYARHHQRRRYPFSRDIPYAEEQLLFFDEEVIQVAAYRLGRSQAGKNIYVVTLRERRESLGEQRRPS